MVTISKSTLAALNLRDAQFGLRHDGRFWVATFQARPHDEPVLLMELWIEPGEAVAALGLAISSALEPGGSLYVS